MTAVESSGPCSLGEECAEYKNLAFLLVSLGITIILVGALFYYVKQRFEVLEVSHKEQIGVMRNFITSISDQFQRMSMANASPSPRPIQEEEEEEEQKQMQMHPLQIRPRDEDRLSISNYDDDDDDDDYDDDSDSSDTDIMDGGGRGGCDIIFCNDDEPSNPRINELSDIKIIELSDDYVGGGGGGDLGDVNESDDSDDVDESDESDSSDSGDDANNGSTDSKRMIVIKTDGSVASPPPPPPKEELENTSLAHSHDRNMMIDLDDFDLPSPSPLPLPIDISNASNSYAQMSIKQLRQSVKRLSEHKHLDTSKLKREQLLALLG